MSPENDHKVKFEDALCDSETELALHIQLPTGKYFWIPKSLVDDDSEVWKKDQRGILVVPEWWATKSGLV